MKPVTPNRPLVPADQTARLLNRLASVRATYKPQAGYLTDTPQEKLPEPERVDYPRRPRGRKVLA